HDAEAEEHARPAQPLGRRKRRPRHSGRNDDVQYDDRENEKTGRCPGGHGKPSLAASRDRLARSASLETIVGGDSEANEKNRQSNPSWHLLPRVAPDVPVEYCETLRPALG